MRKSFVKVFLGMSTLLVIGKFLGFGKSMLIAYHYGAGYNSDVIAFEEGLINEIYSVFATFLGCTFIPTYLSEKHGSREELANKLLSIGLVFVSVAALVCEIFTQKILGLLVPGFFQLYDIDSIVLITRVNMLNLYGVFLINYFATLLQANRIYIFLAIESVISNIFVVIYLILFWKYEILGIIITRILSSLVVLITVLFVINSKSIHRVRLVVKCIDNKIISMIKTAAPLLVVAVLYQANFFVDRSMASTFKSGSIANLNYANLIATALYGVVGYTITTYAYPILAEPNNPRQRTFATYYDLLCSIVVPFAIAMCCYSKDITVVFFGRGHITVDDISLISLLLICYTPGIVAYCIKNFLVKMFYIQKDTKTLVYIDISGVLLNILLNIILGKLLGVVGLAIATTVSYFSSMIVQFYILRKTDVIGPMTDINLKIVFRSLVCLLIVLISGFCADYFALPILIRLTLFALTISISLLITSWHIIKNRTIM